MGAHQTERRAHTRAQGRREAGNDKELNKAIKQCGGGAVGTQCKTRQKQKMSDTLCLVGHAKS